jgi:predicted alpha/beta hydrolase family esterase
MHTIFFLHGLDSSGQGTKGQYFSENFPAVQCPDFHGGLQERLEQFEALCLEENSLLLIGSSFGGLMAVHFAMKYPDRIAKLILLAPALNFLGYKPPEQKLVNETLLVIGEDDDVTPVDPVVRLARETFVNLNTKIVADNHMLHSTFYSMDWKNLLSS